MINIQILGTGCAKCKKLAENAELAATSLGIAYQLEKITEINEILKFGIMLTPGLAINGKVISAGKLLSPDEIIVLL